MPTMPRPAPRRACGARRGETPLRFSPRPFCGAGEKRKRLYCFFTFKRPAFSRRRMRYGNGFTRGLNARDFPKSCLRRRLRRLTRQTEPPGYGYFLEALRSGASVRLRRTHPCANCKFILLAPCLSCRSLGEGGRARGRPARNYRVWADTACGCYIPFRVLAPAKIHFIYLSVARIRDSVTAAPAGRALLIIVRAHSRPLNL